MSRGNRNLSVPHESMKRNRCLRERYTPRQTLSGPISGVPFSKSSLIPRVRLSSLYTWRGRGDRRGFWEHGYRPGGLDESQSMFRSGLLWKLTLEFKMTGRTTLFRVLAQEYYINPFILIVYFYENVVWTLWNFWNNLVIKLKLSRYLKWSFGGNSDFFPKYAFVREILH